jgi:hypothetical protein
MRLPGEGPHEVGIDRKSNGASGRRLGGLTPLWVRRPRDMSFPP